jgi:hypothetical protein
MGGKNNLIHFDHIFDPYLKKLKKIFCSDMAFYAPIESSHRVDTRYAVLKDISSDFWP